MFYNYKYRLYFRKELTSFSQCQDPVYSNDLKKIYEAIDQIQGYDEYMLITETENGPIIERKPLDRPKRLSKKLDHKIK